MYKIKKKPVWRRSGRTHNWQLKAREKTEHIHRPLHAIEDLPGDMNWRSYANSRLKDFLGSR